VFTLSQAEREAKLLPQLTALITHHRAACPAYARILEATGHPESRRYDRLTALPWLPARIFKHHRLASIPDDQVLTILKSSGTTGDVSRIYLDRDAAALGQRMFAQTMRAVIGPRRLPMLIVDGSTVVGDRRSFSARGAGVLGFLQLGRNCTFVLDDDGKPDLDRVRGFLDRHGAAPFLIFGFTFMVWLYLRELARDARLDLSNGTLIHSGGWKKLADRAVDHAEFRRALGEAAGLTRITNFYGMAEQIGVVHLEGPSGSALYSPDFADVVIRDPATWQEAPVGTPGLVQVISTLPRSYPGHSILTEDLGVVHGVDDGEWPGKRFSILGRLPKAEARGCADTFASAS
jgi:hypothetical protein